MRFSLRQLLVGVALISVVIFLFLFVSTASQVGRFNRVINNVRYLTYSPDGTKLAVIHFRARDAGVPFKAYVADVADSVELVDTATLSNATTVDYQFRKGMQGPAFPAYGTLKFSTDGRYLQLGMLTGGPIRSWDIASNCWSNPGAAAETNVFDFAHSPDGRWIAKYSRQNGTSVWDSLSGRKLDLKTTGGRLFNFSPDSRRLAFATRDGVQVWNLDEQRHIRSFHEHYDVLDSVTCLAILPDDDTLVMRCQEGLRLFSVETGKGEFVLQEDFVITRSSTGYGTRGGGHSTSSFAISPDGKLLVAWGTYGMKFFDMSQVCKLQRVAADRISCFEFSPDGKTYATGDWNGKVAIYDVATGKELRSTTLPAVNRKVSGLFDAIF